MPETGGELDQREVWLTEFLNKIPDIDLSKDDQVKLLLDGFFKLNPNELLRLNGFVDMEKLVFLTRRQEGSACVFTQGVERFSNYGKDLPKEYIPGVLRDLSGLREQHLQVLKTPYDTIAEREFKYKKK